VFCSIFANGNVISFLLARRDHGHPDTLAHNSSSTSRSAVIFLLIVPFWWLPPPPCFSQVMKAKKMSWLFCIRFGNG